MASKPRTIELHFPLAGQDRRLAYQQQKPYSTFDCENVWPADPLEGRERGGSRPGTEKALAAQLGGGSPIQLLTSITVMGTDKEISNELLAIAAGRAYYSTGGGAWTEIGAGKNLIANGDFEDYGAGTLDDDTTDTFASWTPYLGAGPGKVEAVSEKHSGSAALKLTEGSDITYIYTTPTDILPAVGSLMRLTFWTRGSGGVAGQYAVRAYPGPVEVVAKVTTGVTGDTWTKVIVDFTYSTADMTHVWVFLYPGDDEDDVAYFDDVVFKNRDAINATAITLQATPLLQKVYIADFRPTRMVGTDGTLASKVLSATSVSDWTAQGIDITRDAVLLTDVAGDDTEDGIYAIASVAEAGITITAPAGLTNGSCNWEIGRTIKVYDPSDDTIAPITAIYGIPPLNCHLACTYRGRLVAIQGNTYYMARQWDPTDWDFAAAATDVQRPIASGSADAGYVPQPVTAVIPHTDDLLIFGCEREVWMLRGDPAMGGSLDAVSRVVGIVSAAAWCTLPEGVIVFLSRKGLYAMAAGSEAEPQPISREVLPEALLDIDVTANTVALAYDGRHQGIHVFITPTAGTTGTHYFFSWQTKGHFPVALPDAQQPTCLLSYAADQGEIEYVLQGCYDGYVRRYATGVTDDDGTTLTSYVEIGPLRLAAPGMDASVTDIGAVLGEDSNDVTWSIMVGDTGEEVADQGTAKASGTFVAGYNRSQSVRVRGPVAKVKLLATDKWAMESVPLTVAPAGRRRP